MKASMIGFCGGLAIVLLARFAHGQDIGVNGSGCQVFAGNCATIVSLTASRSVNIVVTGDSAVAQCDAALPGGMFLPRRRRKVRCDFGNSGQACEIGPLTITAGGSGAGAGGAGGLLDGTPITTQDWEEIIRPNGRVSIICRKTGRAGN